MSLNAAIEQKYLPEVEALTSLLFEFVNKWKTASTLEERLLVEGQAVSLFERLLALEIEVHEIEAGDHPELGEINSTYKDYTYLLRANIAKLRSLAQLYLNHFNTQQFSLMELIGRLKRIKQKHASLALWRADGAKYIVSEHFLNFDHLAADFQSLPQCDVDVNQGVLTLPVRNRIPLQFANARIGSASNGNPGNSDLDVTTNNTNPAFAINGIPDNWFEYERLDAGPLTLTLTLELSQEQIVNQLVIEPVNLGTSLSFEIEDITFSTSNNTSVSIDSLLSGNFEKDFFTVKSVGNDNAWSVTFLPTQAKTISIKFRAPQAYTISTESGDQTGRVVARQRYAVAVKSISAFRNQFDLEGGINSLELSLPGGLYAAIPFLDVWPQNPDLFDLNLEVSFDGGETWQPSEDIDDGIGSTVLMQGDETSMLWRLRIKRDDDSFATIDSFIPDETLTPQTNTLLRSVSRFQSPATINLPEKPKDNKIFVLQPKIARRGDKFEGITLGTGTGVASIFDLPLSVLQNNLFDDVSIYVNKRLYAYQPDSNVLGAGEWSYTDDMKQVEFSSNLPAGSTVELVLRKEKMLFEERSDGFYHQMKMLFDPDKRNINVSYLPRDPVRATMVLPRDQTTINLNASNIFEDTFNLVSEQGVTYTEVTTREAVLSTTNSYFIDYVNGVMVLNSELGADTVQISFEHQAEIPLSINQIESVFVENRPWGVKVNKNAFAARKYSETVGSTPGKTIDVLTGQYTERADVFSGSTNTKTLTYDCIVKNTLFVSSDFLNTTLPPEEVSYIDGQTEFLGLIPMLSEKTVEITADSLTDYVTFNLSAGGLWYKDFDVLFSNASVFATKVGSKGAARNGSPGSYHIANDGLVTLNVGTGGTLTSGIGIRYYYRNPSFRPENKYSVDYENGIVHSYSDQNSAATITYKTACYKVGYDIASQVDSATFNQTTNSVSVRTEGLNKTNNLVKVIWTKAPEETDFEELREFFSPVISVLAFRFN